MAVQSQTQKSCPVEARARLPLKAHSADADVWWDHLRWCQTRHHAWGCPAHQDAAKTGRWDRRPPLHACRQTQACIWLLTDRLYGHLFQALGCLQQRAVKPQLSRASRALSSTTVTHSGNASSIATGHLPSSSRWQHGRQTSC